MKALLLLSTFLIVTLAACGDSEARNSGDDDPTPTPCEIPVGISNGDGGVSSDDPTPCPTEEIDEDDYDIGEFQVETLEFLQLESFPVQVVVGAIGYFPDGCTEIHEVTTEQEANEFLISITTRRPKDAACTEATVDHTESVNLGAVESGEYTVTVNDVVGEFEIAGGSSGSGGTVEPEDPSDGSTSPPGPCQTPGGDPEGSTTSDGPPPCPEETVDENDYTIGQFNVESVDVLIAESFPVQIFVTAAGYFPDGCTELHEVTIDQQGNEFIVTITTRRPADAVCTQAIVEHIESIGLGSPPPGDYTVTVNGVSQEFTVHG
ncbi:MAG: hypothetical protein WEB00_01475 [Dehalococcoidia bacterium]